MLGNDNITEDGYRDVKRAVPKFDSGPVPEDVQKKINFYAGVKAAQEQQVAGIQGSLDQTLAERGSNYGPFAGHAELTQTLWYYFITHAKKSGVPYSAVQAEALHMIFHKLGRIGNGNPNYKDSWVDIAGYATLVANELK